MLERLGNVLYWTCCIVTALAVAAAIAVLFGTEKYLSIVFAVLALICYGIGGAIRYVLTGR
jgi:hypothetical protein